MQDDIQLQAKMLSPYDVDIVLRKVLTGPPLAFPSKRLNEKTAGNLEEQNASAQYR